ncbi:MAG: NEAT domain-containing protein [Clostridia bacterium]|nr:NEAT domain-containing protein [Clostridia bacterium]
MRKSLMAIVLALITLVSVFTFNASAVEMTDGTYEVNIALWHSEDDKESMAASAIETKATIEVKNGKKIMHIKSGEMSMMGIKASLQELKIADVNGNYTEATVETKNSEGDPTGFYFELPHTNEYIIVKVNPHIALMGNKDIGARIKVDYSTLNLIKAAEVVTEKTQATVVQSTAVDKTEDVSEEATSASTEVSTSEVTELVTENAIPTDAASSEQPDEVPGTQTQDDAEPKNMTPVFVAVAVVIVAAIAVTIIIKKKKK